MTSTATFRLVSLRTGKTVATGLDAREANLQCATNPGSFRMVAEAPVTMVPQPVQQQQANASTRYTGALSADARGALRAAITGHPGWDAHRKATGLSLASMTRDNYLDAAAALGIDVHAIVAPHVSGRAAQDRGAAPAPTTDWRAVQRAHAAAQEAASNAATRAVLSNGIIQASPADTDRAPLRPLREMQARHAASIAAAADFENAEDPMTADAPEFDMHDIGEIAAPLSPALLAKLDGLARIAIGDDVSISALYRTARRAHHCATSLKMELERALAAPVDPKAAQLAAMLKPALDFVPPSWTRDFTDYLDIGATIAVVGPAGNGKTTGARKLLERAGFTVYEFDCTDATLPQDLIGRTSLRQDNGATVTEWVAGPIAKAFADPKGAVLLNEYDALDPRTGMALQSALEASDERRVSAPDTGEQIRSTGRCPIVLTLNTIGHGATASYQGRNALDGANRDRIEIVMTGYENEAAILTAHGFAAETAERLASWAENARNKLNKIGSREILSNRRLLTAAALIDRRGYSLNEATDKSFVCRLPERDKTAFAA